MESDKLRGEYKKAMETIDLSKDSRDRILSNIRLEDLSVPAETVKAKKRIPLFVILPVAGAVFAALIVGAILLALAGAYTQKAKSADAAPRTHSVEMDTVEAVAEEIDSEEDDKKDTLSGGGEEGKSYDGENINYFAPQTKDIDNKVEPDNRTGGVILGKLGYVPFENYSDEVVRSEKYGIDVHQYVDSSDSNKKITIVITDGVNDIGGGTAEFKAAGKYTVLYGPEGKDEFNRALYMTEDNMFVVIDSTCNFDLETWEKIVAESAVTD